jgi:hypothetical protein
MKSRIIMVLSLMIAAPVLSIDADTKRIAREYGQEFSARLNKDDAMKKIPGYSGLMERQREAARKGRLKIKKGLQGYQLGKAVQNRQLIKDAQNSQRMISRDLMGELYETQTSNRMNLDKNHSVESSEIDQKELDEDELKDAQNSQRMISRDVMGELYETQTQNRNFLDNKLSVTAHPGLDKHYIKTSGALALSDQDGRTRTQNSGEIDYYGMTRSSKTGLNRNNLKSVEADTE